MTRLKAFVDNPVEKSGDVRPFYALEQIEPGLGRIAPGTEVEERLDETAVLHRPGDVRFGKLRPYLAKSLYMTDHGHGSGELLVLRPRSGSMHGRFLHYLTLSKPFVEWATSSSYGVKMPRTSWEALSAYPVEPPSLGEQQRIAGYLDAETARIDELIAELRTMDLLTAEHSFESQTVLALGGQHREVFLDGAEPWMGALPRHWRTARLKFEARLESGHTPSRSRPELWEDCSIPWVSLNDVSAMSSFEYIESTVNLISEAGLAASSARVLPAGTVVLSRDATIGRTAILAVPMATSQHFADWVCGPNLDPRYLWLLFRTAMQAHFSSLTDGATLRTIGMPDMRQLRVPVPPRNEQEEIIEQSAQVRAREAALREHLMSQLLLLQEHRQALITHAVTQGIDGLPGVA